MIRHAILLYVVYSAALLVAGLVVYVCWIVLRDDDSEP